MSSEKKGPDSPPISPITCIVLAGGLGTRLRSAVPDLPKCMAPVAGEPFLHHVISYAERNGVNHFVFSLGYMHEIIETYLLEKYPNLSYQTVIENEPLGTGGGIQLAIQATDAENVIVLNGDTFFDIPLQTLMQFHIQHHSSCTLALKPMKDLTAMVWWS